MLLVLPPKVIFSLVVVIVILLFKREGPVMAMVLKVLVRLPPIPIWPEEGVVYPIAPVVPTVEL